MTSQHYDKLDDDLRYGDLCPRCNAASGIDTCPCDGKCPLDRDVLPPNYYEPRTV